MRKELSPCDCPSYKFPHRAGGGICGDRDAFAAKVYGPSSGVRLMELEEVATYAEAAAE